MLEILPYVFEPIAFNVEGPIAKMPDGGILGRVRFLRLCCCRDIQLDRTTGGSIHLVQAR